jgi:hypothetical protein
MTIMVEEGMSSNPTVDLVIPAAPKDYSKLPYVVASVREHVKCVDYIYIIVPSTIIVEQRWERVVWYSDDEVLSYDRSLIRHRPSWVFAQMLKIFQDITKRDWFLAMDADVIINRPIPLWTDEGLPRFNLGRDQHCKPYFRFNELILGFGKVYPWSFISEFTLYNKGLVREMLDFCGLSLDGFWDKVVEFTTHTCYMAEEELYGSYIVHEHPGLYKIHRLVANVMGKHGSHVWTDDEITGGIAKTRQQRPDTHLISLHSWS